MTDRYVTHNCRAAAHAACDLGLVCGCPCHLEMAGRTNRVPDPTTREFGRLVAKLGMDICNSYAPPCDMHRQEAHVMVLGAWTDQHRRRSA